MAETIDSKPLPVNGFRFRPSNFDACFSAEGRNKNEIVVHGQVAVPRECRVLTRLLLPVLFIGPPSLFPRESLKT